MHTVGYAGLGNALGTVQLDACVMDGQTLGCGAVAGVENIRHVAALARRVMEKTPHILLVGEGAKLFAVQHWSVEPDMILVGKGIASGYAPLGAVLASARVVEAFERGSGGFLHGFTYQAHPVSTAAGNAVLDYLEAHKLFDRVNAAGQELRCALPLLQSHPNVGEVRGLGLLLGVEFVKNKATRQPFPREQNIAEKIRQACLEEGVLTYPTQGCVDGLRGDHILLAPPFTISTAECSLIARALLAAAARVFSS